jgi:hypothetical protein
MNTKDNKRLFSWLFGLPPDADARLELSWHRITTFSIMEMNGYGV